MSALLRKTVRDQQRGVLAWAIGFAGVAAMYSAFYPSVLRSAGALQRYLANLPEAFRNLIGTDFTTPAGYLRTETFSILAPVLLLVFAIGSGSRAIAGEEEARTLDLLLSTPVRRRDVLFDKWVAMAAAAMCLTAVLGLTIVVVGPTFKLRIAIVDVASACLILYLLGMAFGTVALALGCFTGRRGLANGVTGAAATITYVVNALAPSVKVLSHLRPLSPFRWYLEPDPLVVGITAANIAVLAGIAIVAYVAAWVSFGRRDLRA